MSAFNVPTGADLSPGSEGCRKIEGLVTRAGFTAIYIGSNDAVSVVRSRLYRAAKRDGNAKVTTRWEPKMRKLSVKVDR